MSYIPVAISAYLLNSLSVLTDKFLLSKRIPDPLTYIFYISVLSLIALVLLPFTTTPSHSVFALASFSTLVWTGGSYFLFKSLKVGLADRVVPVIGTLVPIFLIAYYYLIAQNISLNELWGASALTFGLLILVLPFLKLRHPAPDERFNLSEFSFEVLSAFLFALSYILLKQVYLSVSFLTGLVWSRFVLIPIALVILAWPDLRKRVFNSQGEKINLLSITGLFFIAGQISGGFSQILLTFAISFANPALVNSLAGVQYVFLFLFSISLRQKFPQIFDETVTKSLASQKFLGILLIGLGLYIIAFARSSSSSITLGLTYSPRYAQSLGLNPKLTFIEILDQLNPKVVRIPIYWDLLEKKKDQFDFGNNDYFINNASRRGIKITLVIGYKLTRYPECYTPTWANNLSSQEFDAALLREINQVVTRYKGNPGLEIWQIENEPLFPFGICPRSNYARLKKEINLVRSLDSNHPVMVTESGEFGLWLTSAKRADIVGTTLYRRTLAPYFPEFKSPLPPFFYQVKKDILHLFYPNKKVFVSELQAEPWSNSPLPQTPYDYQTLSFPLKDLKENVDFAAEAGFDRVYFWGVEWWYYLKKEQHPEYLNQAILIYNDTH